MRSLLPCVLLAVGLVDRSTAQCETHKLLPSTPVKNGFYGGVVAVEGTTAVVSFNEGVGKHGAGVYERIGGSWVEVQKLYIPHYDTTFSTTVALSGETLMMGSGNGGPVHVFERRSGVWAKTQVLKGFKALQFGSRIALDGDHAAIAAPMDAKQKDRGGAVYTFERIAGEWKFKDRLTAAPVHSWGFFGLGLALRGNVLVVGEPGYPVSGGWINTVQVFRHKGGSWKREARIVGDWGTAFGYSVDVQGDELFVGAFKDFKSKPWRGTVIVFRNAGGWQEVARITTGHPDADHYFGATVKVDGDTLAVSSSSNDLSLGERVSIFTRGPSAWEQVALLKPYDITYTAFTNSLFGGSLSLDRGALFVGSAGDKQLGDYSGSAYVFALANIEHNYCGPANLNSTGGSASLAAQGCATVAENELLLVASGLPASVPGFFLTSRVQGFVPFFAGSQGNLCLGGGIGRFHHRVDDSGSTGELLLKVDVSALPTPGGAHSAKIGETWNFQCWYRDWNPGPTSNLSDAISITLQ